MTDTAVLTRPQLVGVIAALRGALAEVSVIVDAKGDYDAPYPEKLEEIKQVATGMLNETAGCCGQSPEDFAPDGCFDLSALGSSYRPTVGGVYPWKYARTDMTAHPAARWSSRCQCNTCTSRGAGPSPHRIANGQIQNHYADGAWGDDDIDCFDEVPEMFEWTRLPDEVGPC